jgi:ABC-2 type transport system permease protein
MKHSLIIGQRVLRELSKDKRLFGLSIVGPFILIYLLKIFIDSMPEDFPAARYAMPFAAFIVHFFSFILCGIVLVQERTAGTLERMFISGFSRPSIIGGYVLGYLGLVTLQATVVLGETVWLVDLDYGSKTLLLLLVTIFMLSTVSVMLGIFASTFARHAGHILPFIPLVMIPSLFLSGLLIDTDQLPDWAEFIGMLFPFRYANNVIQELIGSTFETSVIYRNLLILGGYVCVLLIIASRTLKETD